MKRFSLIWFFLSALMKAWHPTGHFLTAIIAQKEMTKKDPSLLPYLESILKVLSVFTKEKQEVFIEEAEFPDDIKYLNWKSFDSWHFHDSYIFADDAPKKDLAKNPQNVVWAINQCKATLRNEKTSQLNIFFGKSFMLRYLVHLVGDIHQPLHNAAYVSKQFPDGDAGGNNFDIKYPGVYDLHTFWDLCLKQYPEVRAPLEDKHLKFLEDTATEITEEYTRQKLKDQLAEDSVAAWAVESFNLAKEVVYNGIEVGGVPSEAYIKRGFALVKQQLALGGYRLADILLDIFKDDKNRPPVDISLRIDRQETTEKLENNRIKIYSY